MKSHRINKLQKSKYEKNYLKIHEPMKKYDLFENMKNMKNMKEMKIMQHMNTMENMNKTMVNNMKYGKILRYDNWTIADISRIERNMLKDMKRKNKMSKNLEKR